MSSSRRRGAGDGGVTVLESVHAPSSIVKYVDSFVRHAPTDITYRFWSWRQALTGDYDVFHVHWPEYLLRDRVRWRRWVRRGLYEALLWRLRSRRVPVVRTVHNEQPHSGSTPREVRQLARLEALVAQHVVMSSCTTTPDPAKAVVIPHGHFIEPLGDLPVSERVPKRVLLFGRIEPYKGVLDLIRAASELEDHEVEVRIVGSADASMRQEIADALAAHGGGAKVTLDLRRVSDEEMVAEMTRATLIALPYTDAGNGNSGVALVALSLGRPVLVYRACVMERLAADVGPAWVQMMDAKISGVALETALSEVADIGDADAPDLTGRDWSTMARAYAEVFRNVKDGA